MGLDYLKIANIEHHEYFVQTVYKILSDLGFDYNYNDIEEMSIENGYSLYFHNKKTGRWHLGIWAVGKWNIKERYDGKVINGGYGIDTYKPLTISVFIIHDWTYDKFRPSRADREMLIDYNGEINDVVKELKHVFRHPIDSYCSIAGNGAAKHNKYVTYINAWYNNVFAEFVRRKQRRLKGYVATRLFMVKARFDKRVAHREYRFHKDKWNNEYEIAIVFRYGETEWDDWKAWFDYKTLFEKLYSWNIWVNFNYLDEDGNIPAHIWRGVYWDGEPDKE